MDQLLILGGTMLGGLIQKHVFKWLPNKYIPYINVIGSGVVGHFIPGVGAQQGAILGMAAVGGHQAIKIPVKAKTGKSI